METLPGSSPSDSSVDSRMSIEKNFDVSFVSSMALREKQIQQNYRPIIAVHKWFARRPGTLFRALLLSEFGAKPLRDAFFASNQFPKKVIADPFMGGGTPLIEANRLGCDVVGFDVNPMAYWIVKQELDSLDLVKYRGGVEELAVSLRRQVGELYRTKCLECGSTEAQAKYFLWVKTTQCPFCSVEIDLFPGYLIAENRRHPRNVFVCPSCGDLTETTDKHQPGQCTSCAHPLSGARIRNGVCTCTSCSREFSPSAQRNTPPLHRMFAIEYHCFHCRASHTGRFFKKPDLDDLSRYKSAEAALGALHPTFIPEDEIPRGDESDRLHRWGYRKYREMFNARQLLGLELSARFIAEVEDQNVREALATNLSDLLRYQNMLCRYDTMALKSLDIFSVHGFPVGLVQCESNFMGLASHNGGTIGSGGWFNITEKYTKAKAYCIRPFETREENGRKTQVFTSGEWIGSQDLHRRHPDRSVTLRSLSAMEAEIPAASLDAVLTDPPYFGNVQYAELMDFCYVWLRRLVGRSEPAFGLESTRNPDELTGNVTMDRDLAHFAEGLSEVFRRMSRALKSGAPLAFTFHHNRQEAYLPVAVAILDSGLTCSASLPCPAEMGASIHISGTGSSVVDTVFVCRSTGRVSRVSLADNADDISGLVAEDIRALERGGLKPTKGDVRCVIFGHLVRLAVWNLRVGWNSAIKSAKKLELISSEIDRLGGKMGIEKALGLIAENAPRLRYSIMSEAAGPYTSTLDDVPF